MKNSLLLSTALLVAATSAHTGWGAETEKIPLRVLYLSRTDAADRTGAFADFLSQRFQECTVAKRAGFEGDLLRSVDVVVLDWSQGERVSNKPESPVGPLEEWDKPTVLLGSAGLLMAKAWRVIGDAG